MAYRIIASLCRLRCPVYNKLRHFHSSPISFKLVQFILSDIGEGIREVTVRDWYVKPGDKIAQFDNVCLVESDKASVNITSRYDGTVQNLYHEIGDIAFVGKPLLDIDTNDSGSSDDENEEEKKISSTFQPKAEMQQVIEKLDYHKALATPSVRRIAKEYNINLHEVKGTGKSGRILKEDIINHPNLIEKKSHQSYDMNSDKVDAAEFKKVSISGIRKVMVNTMTKSNSIPTFGYCDEINVTKLVAMREEVKEMVKKKSISLTYMPFFVKALSKSLEEYPELNGTVDENCTEITYKLKHNIGIAMDTPSGLIVPNIKNVQSLSIVQIALELNRLLSSGKKGILNPQDLSGGTFTISNIGIIGGTYTRPLILPPELAIAALGKIQEKPIFNEDGDIVKGHIMCVSWAADHRVIDGATMARFANVWKNYIEYPSTLTLDL